jgi:hypothetical protein
MAQGSRDSTITPATVEARLAAAGRVLLALPHAGCFPMGFRTLWPDLPREAAPCAWLPSAAEISAMDEAYRWVCLIADIEERRLVLMRSLVRLGADGKPRHVWTWRRLRKMTGRHPDTLQAVWGRGIDRIARALNARAPSDRYTGAGRLRGALLPAGRGSSHSWRMTSPDGSGRPR